MQTRRKPRNGELDLPSLLKRTDRSSSRRHSNTGKGSVALFDCATHICLHAVNGSTSSENSPFPRWTPLALQIIKQNRWLWKPVKTRLTALHWSMHVRTNSRGIETATQPSLQGVVFVHAKELTHGKPFSFFLFCPKSWTYPLGKKVNFWTPDKYSLTL